MERKRKRKPNGEMSNGIGRSGVRWGAGNEIRNSEREREREAFHNNGWIDRIDCWLQARWKPDPGHVVERETEERRIVVSFRSFCCFVCLITRNVDIRTGGGGTDSDQLGFLLLFVLLFTVDFFVSSWFEFDCSIKSRIGFGFCVLKDSRFIHFSWSPSKCPEFVFCFTFLLFVCVRSFVLLNFGLIDVCCLRSIDSKLLSFGLF